MIQLFTIFSSQILLMTDPSGLDAIISSSSSPYSTCDSVTKMLVPRANIRQW